MQFLLRGQCCCDISDHAKPARLTDFDFDRVTVETTAGLASHVVSHVASHARLHSMELPCATA